MLRASAQKIVLFFKLARLGYYYSDMSGSNILDIHQIPLWFSRGSNRSNVATCTAGEFDRRYLSVFLECGPFNINLEVQSTLKKNKIVHVPHVS